jgi:arabinan endo-1,5-alpha-L-arabinosidase
MRVRHCGVVLFGSLCLAACGGGQSNPPNTPNPPAPPPDGGTDTPVTVLPDVDAPIVYNDLPVHDPSVVRADDGSFYVIGSHLAMAQSTDLVSWQSVADGVNDANPLFATYASEISEGIAYVGGHVGSWASDIVKLDDGRWYFYYNHCATADDGLCDFPRSYLGVAVSDSIEGPYSDLGAFLWSGQTDDEIATGGYGVGSIASYDPTVHPNAIDPTTFYDEDGELWMVYGSYSGGIFILAMDETTGKPAAGQGYGTHLAGGFHGAIEGPFILYSPDTDYYYLFTSFGGFEANDGYNMRIARSRDPDGPYVDAEGNDMVQASGNLDGIEPYGVKLMGGFEFGSDLGDPAPGRGYLAPGHNSAYHDAGTGKYLLIHHTRFPNRGEQHAIRVHEMFVTENDWLVASPHRYAPLSGGNEVGVDDAVGLYRFVDHGKDINREARISSYLSLNDDDSISGAATGSYRLSTQGGNDIGLTLGNVTYEGVILWQWDDGEQRLTPSISAVSPEGSTVWLSKMEDKSTEEVLQAIADAIEFPDAFSGDGLDFPSNGTRGATIEWSSNNGEVIKNDGTVIRPNVGEGDRTVTITAVITFNGESMTVTRDVLVPERSPFNRIAQYDFENDLTETLGNFSSGEATGDRIWKLSEGIVGYAAGHDNEALSLDGTAGVRLPDGLISNYEYSVSMWANPTAITQFTTAFFGAVDEQQDGGDPFSNHWISLLPQSWDGNTMLWSGSDPFFDGITGQLIPEAAWSHLGFSVHNGLVRVYIDGVQYFSGGNLSDFFTSGEGRFAIGVNYWDLPFNGLIDELKVYDAALGPAEMQALDIDYIPSDQLLQMAVDLIDPGDLSAVREDIHLPPTGPFAAAIEWVSSDPATIFVEADTGVVTRPEAGAPPADVTLTAMVSLDGDNATRDFAATVSPLGPPDPVARYSFEDNLADSTGNFAAGTPTGDRIAAAGGTIAFGDGVQGRALVLDGATGVALDAGLVSDATYTISLWLNPSALTFYTSALFGGPDCTTDAASCDSWISVVPGGLDPGAETMLWSGTAWFDAVTGTRIPLDQWTQFVAVNDNGAIRIYLDGVETFNGTNFPDVFTGTADPSFWIGVNHWDPAYAGSIDELKVFDEAMTASDVASLYEAEAQ